METDFLKKFIENEYTDINFPVRPPCNESRIANSGCVDLLIQFDRVVSFNDTFDRVNAFKQLISTARVFK